MIFKFLPMATLITTIKPAKKEQSIGHSTGTGLQTCL